MCIALFGIVFFPLDGIRPQIEALELFVPIQDSEWRVMLVLRLQKGKVYEALFQQPHLDIGPISSIFQRDAQEGMVYELAASQDASFPHEKERPVDLLRMFHYALQRLPNGAYRVHPLTQEFETLWLACRALLERYH